MQFTLSTIFLIFFNVAASLALFGTGGLWIAAVMLLAAFCLNRIINLTTGVVCAFLLIFIGIICPGLLPTISSAREAFRRAVCVNNLKQIGFALHKYQDAYKHFPATNTIDQNGKPLFSWRAEILPIMDYGVLYDSLKKDEPWNSPFNTNVLSQSRIYQYECPCNDRNEKDFTTNYIAIIGPGTAWREDGPVNFSDLPDRGSHTVMLVEVVNSGVHWAEPRDLPVEEALEHMKTGKGLRISTMHPSVVNVLFADGMVRSLPAKMPISLWRKILAGEVTDLDRTEDNIDESAPDMVDVSVAPPQPGKWTIIIGLIVWLLSVVLLFRRAIKSRPKPAPVT